MQQHLLQFTVSEPLQCDPSERGAVWSPSCAPLRSYAQWTGCRSCKAAPKQKAENGLNFCGVTNPGDPEMNATEEGKKKKTGGVPTRQHTVGRSWRLLPVDPRRAAAHGLHTHTEKPDAAGTLHIPLPNLGGDNDEPRWLLREGCAEVRKGSDAWAGNPQITLGRRLLVISLNASWSCTQISRVNVSVNSNLQQQHGVDPQSSTPCFITHGWCSIWYWLATTYMIVFNCGGISSPRYWSVRCESLRVKWQGQPGTREVNRPFSPNLALLFRLASTCCLTLFEFYIQVLKAEACDVCAFFFEILLYHIRL